MVQLLGYLSNILLVMVQWLGKLDTMITQRWSDYLEMARI